MKRRSRTSTEAIIRCSAFRLAGAAIPLLLVLLLSLGATQARHRFRHRHLLAEPRRSRGLQSLARLSGSMYERFIPGEEKLEDGELRVTVLGSGNPWTTRPGFRQRARRSGQPRTRHPGVRPGERFLANYASLKLPVNKLNKVFLTHLHADHMSDILTLAGSYAKVGRSDGPVYVWGPRAHLVLIRR